MQNTIYKVVSEITEGRERDGSYQGNGHHLAREITAAVVKAIGSRDHLTDDEFLKLLKARFDMPLQKEQEPVMQRKEIESLIKFWEPANDRFSDGVVAALKTVIYGKSEICQMTPNTTSPQS